MSFNNNNLMIANIYDIMLFLSFIFKFTKFIYLNLSLNNTQRLQIIFDVDELFV